MPFALMDDQQVPISCDSLEGPDAPSTMHYSVVAALTVALRSGTNAWIQSMTFVQNGEGRPPEKLNPGQKATVKVTAAPSVTGAGRTLAPLTLYAGWSD